MDPTLSERFYFELQRSTDLPPDMLPGWLHDHGSDAWRWLCRACGGRGQWQLQSEGVPLHQWRTHFQRRCSMKKVMG